MLRLVRSCKCWVLLCWPVQECRELGTHTVLIQVQGVGYSEILIASCVCMLSMFLGQLPYPSACACWYVWPDSMAASLENLHKQLLTIFAVYAVCIGWSASHIRAAIRPCFTWELHQSFSHKANMLAFRVYWLQHGTGILLLWPTSCMLLLSALLFHDSRVLSCGC